MSKMCKYVCEIYVSFLIKFHICINILYTFTSVFYICINTYICVCGMCVYNYILCTKSFMVPPGLHSIVSL